MPSYDVTLYYDNKNGRIRVDVYDGVDSSVQLSVSMATLFSGCNMAFAIIHNTSAVRYRPLNYDLLTRYKYTDSYMALWHSLHV